MAIQLKHMRSGVANVAPTQAQIALGQIAINYQDERLFIRNAAGEVVVIASSAAVQTSLVAVKSVNTVTPDVNGNVTLLPAQIGTDGVAPLDATGKVPSQYLPASLVGSVVYTGTWNASTNNPTLPDPTTVKGNYYVVTVAGTQFGLNYGVGDWAISNGIAWQKVDAVDAVTSVAGKVGTVVLAAADIASGTFTADRLGATPGNNMLLTTNGTGAPTWVAQSAVSGVTSVGLGMPPEFTVTGSPVTSTGAFAVSKANQNANLVYAGPGTGAAAAPTFRALVPTDIPALDASKIISGSFPADQLGTGAAVGTVLSIDSNGNPVWVTVGSLGVGTVTSVGMTVPSALLAVTGSPITSTGTLAVTLPVRAPNLVFAGPVSGANAAPAFRALDPADMPVLDEGTF